MKIEGIPAAAVAGGTCATTANRSAAGTDLPELDGLQFQHSGVINSRMQRPALAREFDAELASTPLRADTCSDGWEMCEGRPVRSSTQQVFAVLYVDDQAIHYYLCEPGRGLVDSRFVCATLEYVGDDDGSTTLYLRPWQSWDQFKERYLQGDGTG